MPDAGPRAEALRSHLPAAFEPAHGPVLDAIGAELDLLWAAVRAFHLQAYPQDATWGLGRLEGDHGMPFEPDASDAERRTRLLAHMRGFGPASRARIVELANQWDNGLVRVSDDPENSRVLLRFVDVRGVPEHLDNVLLALRRFVPAHLTIDVEYIYTVWQDFRASGLTWDQFDALGVDWDAVSTTKLV